MKCDHVVAVIPEHTISESNKIEMTIHPVRIKSSDYSKKSYRKIFNDEKFTFCPDCGEKIDWKTLEEALAQWI